MGYYQATEDGITSYPDSQMYDGIRNFQKDNNLKIDAVMKPNGETVDKMNENIALAEAVSEAGMQGCRDAGIITRLGR